MERAMNPKLLPGLALVLSSGLVGCSTAHEKPLSIKEQNQVKAALAALKPGMTGQQVMVALAKTPLKHHECSIAGGGSLSYYWDLYATENAVNFEIIYDCTTHPSSFIKYELCGGGWKTQ